jgi:hypothetical protein
MKTISYNFGDVEWGPDEAKGDSLLKTYFVKIPEYDALAKGEYRYIIGRKGTGKTAIIQQMISEIEDRYDCFYKSLSLRDFPIQDLRALKDKGMNNKYQYVPIWTFLIVIELCKLLLSNQLMCENETAHELNDFIKANFPGDVGFAETLTYLVSNKNKVQVSPAWLNFEKSKSSARTIFVPVHYQQITSKIIDLLKMLDSNGKYYLFFDELDEGYKIGDKNLNLLLLALLRAVEDTALAFKDSRINYFPVLALRSDIYNRLEDNDLNKLDDYLIDLKWTKEYGSAYSLLDLIKARINASIDVFNPEKAWESISDNANVPSKTKELWSYIYTRTFERPRDIVKFMKCCKKYHRQGKLTYDTVRCAEPDYSNWFYKEFKDEAQSFLPIYKEVLSAITNLGKGRFTMSEIKEHLDAIPEVVEYMDNHRISHDKIMEYLFDTGVIGTYGNNKKWLFKYKDSDLPLASQILKLNESGAKSLVRMSSPP